MRRAVAAVKPFSRAESGFFAVYFVNRIKHLHALKLKLLDKANGISTQEAHRKALIFQGFSSVLDLEH